MIINEKLMTDIVILHLNFENLSKIFSFNFTIKKSYSLDKCRKFKLLLAFKTQNDIYNFHKLVTNIILN